MLSRSRRAPLLPMRTKVASAIAAAALLAIPVASGILADEDAAFEPSAEFSQTASRPGNTVDVTLSLGEEDLAGHGVNAFVGTAALELCYCADNRFGLFYEEALKPWDIAAAMLVIREAGGVILTGEGGEPDLGNVRSIVAGSKAAVDEFLAMEQGS